MTGNDSILTGKTRFRVQAIAEVLGYLVWVILGFIATIILGWKTMQYLRLENSVTN